jgi:hypothetical protein
MTRFVEVQRGHDGNRWLERSLASGNTLSSQVLKRGVTGSATAFLLVAAPTVEAAESWDLSSGGTADGYGGDACLAAGVRSLVTEEGDWLVIEDETRKPTDPAVERRGGKVRVVDGEVLWVTPVSATPDNELVAFIRSSSTGYPCNAFLSGAENPRTESLSTVAQSVYAGFVAAFDAERFLYWRT